MLLAAAPTTAQFVLPSLVGTWKPVVGRGAIYRLEAQGRDPEQLETSVVAEEAGAVWLEITSDANHKQTIMKLLVSPQRTQRVILKMTGKPAVEVPPDSCVGGGIPVDVKRSGRLLGRETTSTPAGEFECEHYDLPGQNMEAWISPAVFPYGLVKLKSTPLKITLQKTLTGTRTHITEVPQPIELP
jgi:hypothetical protein